MSSSIDALWLARSTINRRNERPKQNHGGIEPGSKHGSCRARSAFGSALPSTGRTIQSEQQADVAQLVEQLIRNQQVVSSSLTVGSIPAHTHLKTSQMPSRDIQVSFRIPAGLIPLCCVFHRAETRRVRPVPSQPKACPGRLGPRPRRAMNRQ